MKSKFIIVESGAPHFSDQLPEVRLNRLAIINRTWENMHAFDGRSHFIPSLKKIPSFGWLSRLLARTVFNPTVETGIDWEHQAEYDKGELIKLVREGLRTDDDIIQQWFDGPDVIKLLNAADSWDTMLIAVHAICGEHETDPDAMEYVESVLGKRA